MNNNCKWLAQVVLSAIGMIFASPHVCEAGTWTPLNNQPHLSNGVNAPLLLTDGSVMVQNFNDLNNRLMGQMWKLTPDINGSYINGTWSQIATLPRGYTPLAFSSAVLADGRVIIFGGEYNDPLPNFKNKGAIYDPVNNVWRPLKAPSFFPDLSIGDAASVVLQDGAFMLACSATSQAALLDPKTLTWSPTGNGKMGINDEEGWTLLPGGDVLTVDTCVQGCPGSFPKPPVNSEVYNPATGE